jgi:signal transduction histidine kinase
MVIAVPTSTGGAVVARIRSSAIDELFRTIQFNDGSVIAVLDAEGHILYRRQTTETHIDREVSGSSLFAAAGVKQAALTEIESPYDGVRRLYGVRAGATNSVVIVGIPSAVLYEPARRRFTMYLFFSLITFACAVIAGMFIARSITRPIRQLQETTQAFGADQITARALVSDSGEIGELAVAFNNMADKIVEREERLKELDRLKSEFVGNVSHELRTPLTTIKTLTHVLHRKVNGDRDLREHLDTIAAECDRQIDFVSNLLDLSRIEAGAYEINFVGVNPSEVLVSCVSRLIHNAEARHEQLTLELPSELPMVRADHASLRRVLCNLIENAIKYTPDYGRIRVGAFVENDEIVFYVRDTGPGIRQQDSSRIFDKFYRADTRNGRNHDPESSGVGLGLYIVRNLVTQLGGRVTAANAIEGGASFEVHLPMWDLPRNIQERGNGSKA